MSQQRHTTSEAQYLLSTALAVVGASVPAAAWQGTTTRISMTVDGQELSAHSGAQTITADGRFIAFASAANVLGVDGPGGLFLLDRQTQAVERVNLSTGGAIGNGATLAPSLTPDARFVAFASTATNLAGFDANGEAGFDVFVRDRATGSTTRASVNNANLAANGDCWHPSISADGRYVAFESNHSTNLDLGEGFGVFVRDRVGASTVLVTEGLGGVNANHLSYSPSISADGRWIAFASYASNLLATDDNFRGDVFVYDRVNASLEIVSLATDATPGNDHSTDPSISDDARYVAFLSEASDLVSPHIDFGSPQLFVRDRLTGTTVRGSVATSGAYGGSEIQVPSLSHNGRFVTFATWSSNYVNGDTNNLPDLFRRDLLLGITLRVSVGNLGQQGNDVSGDGSYSTPDSDRRVVSDDGNLIVFWSRANNLARADTNYWEEAFLRDLVSPPAAFETYCTAKTNSLGCAPVIAGAGTPSVSSAAPFDISATRVLNQRNGLLFYGLAAQAAPFQGGLSCVQSPTVRTPIQTSGGNASGSDCTGAFHFDMNARIQSGADQTLVVGAAFFAQFWSRDSASPSTTSLSNAIAGTIQP